jgi:hypothetical protein
VVPVRRSVKTLAAAADDGKPGYELVYLPVELICAQLLVNDLTLPHSLPHRELFPAPVRRRLLAELDGQPSCWHFGRRVPISLIEDAKALLLARIDDRGETIVGAAENHRHLYGDIVRPGAA